MIIEDYCSVEIAKLLEEKDFPIWEYHNGVIGVFNGIAVSKITKELIEEKMLSCIPHSVVMKWLREIHNLHITIDCDICYSFDFYSIIRIKSEESWKTYVEYEDEGSNTYEEAVEKAIKYCLTNLI